jgi:hypothetical protein
MRMHMCADSWADKAKSIIAQLHMFTHAAATQRQLHMLCTVIDHHQCVPVYSLSLQSNDPQLDRLTAPVGPNGSCGLSDVLALLIAEMSDTRIATPDTKEQLVACIASLLDHPSKY